MNLTAEQLASITKTHIADDATIAERLRFDDPRIKYAEGYALLTDADLDEIAQHGSDAGRKALILRVGRSRAATKAVLRSGGPKAWAADCGPETAVSLLTLDGWQMAQLGVSDSDMGDIVRTLCDRHVADETILCWQPDRLDDAMVDSIIAHGDPEALERLGGLNHPFTAAQVRVLKWASGSFAARLDRWRKDAGDLFADREAMLAAL